MKRKGKRCYRNSTGVVKNVRNIQLMILVHFHWNFFFALYLPLLLSISCLRHLLHSSFTISPISFFLKSMKVLFSLPSIRACLSWMNINEQKRKRFDLFHPNFLSLSIHDYASPILFHTLLFILVSSFPFDTIWSKEGSHDLIFGQSEMTSSDTWWWKRKEVFTDCEDKTFPSVIKGKKDERM